MSIQKASRRAEGVEPGDLVRCSQLYRSALHECVLSLRKMAAGENLTWSIKYSTCTQIDHITFTGDMPQNMKNEYPKKMYSLWLLHCV